MLPRYAYDEAMMKIPAAKDRLNPKLGILIHVLLIAGPFLNIIFYLKPLLLLISAIGIIKIVQRLLNFKRWNDEMKHVVQFIKSFAFMISVIIVENFCTWATSASDYSKYDYQPLQDNGEIAIHWLFRTVPFTRIITLGWRVDMHWLLYSFISLCLSVAWDAVPYSGFAIGTRLMDTIGWSHAIRTVAFMVTILPNPRPGCYAQNFPPVPDNAWDFIKIGFGAKRGHGCNDLVISGHGVVYAVVALAIQTYYPLPWRKGGPAVVAWLAVTKLCLQEVVDQTHYSVDMLLAVAVTVLVWEWRKDLYPTTAVWRVRKPNAPGDPVPLTLIWVVLASLAIVAIGIMGVA